MSTTSPLADRKVATVFASNESERVLVERAQRGDHVAFERLLDARLASTFRTVLAILGDEADARDTTQAIFVATWRQLPSLRNPDLFGAWFGRIVVNSARSAMRSRRRRVVREITFGQLPDEGTSIHTDAAHHVDRSLALDRLERAFERLTPEERLCLWLHHYEGWSLEEMGRHLGVPSKTVKSRLFVARRALERALQAEDR